jgi:class 3 adenylate cyclase
LASISSADIDTPRRARRRQPWDLAGLAPRTLATRGVFLGLILVVVLVSGITVVNALRWVDKPFPGFLVNERMVLGNIGRYDWTGTRAGLKWPDRIVRADDRPIASMRDLDAIVAGKAVGEAVTYEVERDGRVLEMRLGTMRFTWLDLFMTFGITFLSGWVYLSIGVAVFVLKPDTEVSWVFFLACLFLSLFTITSFDVQSTHWGFIRLYFLVNALFPAAFVHLSLLFPERVRGLAARPHVLAVPYVLAALLVVPLEFLYPRPAFLPFQDGIRFYAILGALAIIASTVHAFASRPSALARQRAKVILSGASMAFPLPATAFFLSLAGPQWVTVPIQNNFLAIPITLFPASIAYAIARHNLFDVDVFIKRAAGYVVMTAVVGTAYVSMQTLLGALFLQPLFGEQGEAVYPLVFALLVVFLFNPVSRRVQGSVDRIFFRTQFDYKHTVSAVSNALTSMLDLNQIVSQVVYTIRSEMFVDTAGVIVVEPERKECLTFFAGEDDPRETTLIAGQPIAYDDPLLELVRAERGLVTRYDVDEDPRYAPVREACLPRFAELAVTVVMPLVYQNRVTGVFALGEKKSGRFYSRDDIELLGTMANQAAVAIENATTHQEVVRYAEELAASLQRIQLLESIKTNLAKFVPKTVQELIEESPEAPSFDKREVDCSVLFADITGYTRLSARLELDVVNRLVERYFGAFLDEILARGGDVNETAGDGLMVIFRKRDPRRHARAAVLAALGIQRRAHEINVELAGHSEPIVMKVGVNSGIAAVGATRIEGAAGTRWTYTASGPTTNVAARLAALAEGAGGGVIVSEETWNRIGDEFQSETLGPQLLKNVPEPVLAFRVLGQETPPVQPAPDAGRARRLYVVSRRRPDVYEKLLRRFAGRVDVAVVLDRRIEEPRQGPGDDAGAVRRPPDRRASPAGDLDADAYVVIDGPDHEADPRPRPSA